MGKMRLQDDPEWKKGVKETEKPELPVDDIVSVEIDEISTSTLIAELMHRCGKYEAPKSLELLNKLCITVRDEGFTH